LLPHKDGPDRADWLSALVGELRELRCDQRDVTRADRSWAKRVRAIRFQAKEDFDY